jgi:hypothetical protein
MREEELAQRSVAFGSLATWRHRRRFRPALVMIFAGPATMVGTRGDPVPGNPDQSVQVLFRLASSLCALRRHVTGARYPQGPASHG